MLFGAYRELMNSFPDVCEGLYGSQTQPEGAFWLAIDRQHHPSFLIPAIPGDTRSDIELRYIEVRFSRECLIATSGSDTAHGVFTIVRLAESDPDLVRLFLRLIEEAFFAGAAPTTNREVGERILEIANLFRQIEGGAKDMLGLWGELYIIHECTSRLGAARKWLIQKTARYDFVTTNFALEVKTTLKAQREHRFSLEQLRPSGELAVYVASLQLVQSRDGKTIEDLVTEIMSSLDDADTRRAFLGLCLVKGGEDIFRSDMRLQPLSRRVNVAYFAASSIAAPVVNPEARISNVTFDAVLDEATRLSSTEQKRIVEALALDAAA
jgi:hypothetical protein